MQDDAGGIKDLFRRRSRVDHLVPLILMAGVVGLSKGGLASAAALAVPFLALFMNPVEAAAILLPVFLMTDWAAVWIYRRQFSGRNVAILIPAMVFGTAMATLLTPRVPESGLLMATGLIGLWYCGRSWMARGREEATEARVGPGLFWGTLTGIASFIAHSGSPPAQAYLMPQKLPKLRFAGTIAIVFAAGNIAKLPGYWALGALEGLDWSLTAILAATGIFGAAIGRWITGKLPEATYLRVVEALLLSLSVLLLAKAGEMAMWQD